MSKLSHIPLLRLLFPFVAGIISVIYLKPPLLYLLYCFGITLVVYFLLMLLKKITENYKIRWVFGLLLYVNMLMAGACLTSLQYNKNTNNTQLLTETDNQLLIGEIIEPIQIKENTIKAILAIKGVKSDKKWVIIY